MRALWEGDKDVQHSEFSVKRNGKRLQTPEYGGEEKFVGGGGRPVGETRRFLGRRGMEYYRAGSVFLTLSMFLSKSQCFGQNENRDSLDRHWGLSILIVLVNRVGGPWLDCRFAGLG